MMCTELASEPPSDSETLIFLRKEDGGHYNSRNPFWPCSGGLARTQLALTGAQIPFPLPHLSVPKEPSLHGALGPWGYLSPPLSSSQNRELLPRELSFSFPNKSPKGTAPLLPHRIPSLSPGAPSSRAVSSLLRVTCHVHGGDSGRVRWGERMNVP